MDANEKRAQLGGMITFRAPDALLRAADKAASRSLISKSDYARMALLHQLTRDGLAPSEFTATAA